MNTGIIHMQGAYIRCDPTKCGIWINEKAGLNCIPICDQSTIQKEVAQVAPKMP